MSMQVRLIGAVLGIVIAIGTMQAGRAAERQLPPKKSSDIPATAAASSPKPKNDGRFALDPNTSIEDLLPKPPPRKRIVGPVLSDDLALTPEVMFQARIEETIARGTPAERIARQLEKIRQVDVAKRDAFMTLLLQNRDDLSGLPFTLGDNCRMSREYVTTFSAVVSHVRTPSRSAGRSTKPLADDDGASSFWSDFNFTPQVNLKSDVFNRARVAALMQVMAVETAEMRLGLVKFLARVPHRESTIALARLAIFSAEPEVRDAAADALRVRPNQDYTDILLKGLRYPWPAVAKRSAALVTRLGRTDLIPELVALASADDPRMPAVKTVDGKQATIVRELVKVNHLRNCMLCHAPTDDVNGTTLSAPVPVPGESLPQPSVPYYQQQSFPELNIRFDATYLRQDFSAMLPVGDAKPWPEMQRFDFLVRERKLTVDEAKEYRAKLTSKEGEASPYHQAAQTALRELTK